MEEIDLVADDFEIFKKETWMKDLKCTEILGIFYYEIRN